MRLSVSLASTVRSFAYTCSYQKRISRIGAVREPETPRGPGRSAQRSKQPRASQGQAGVPRLPCPCPCAALPARGSLLRRRRRRLRADATTVRLIMHCVLLMHARALTSQPWRALVRLSFSRGAKDWASEPACGGWDLQEGHDAGIVVPARCHGHGHGGMHESRRLGVASGGAFGILHVEIMANCSPCIWPRSLMYTGNAPASNKTSTKTPLAYQTVDSSGMQRRQPSYTLVHQN